MVQVLLTDKVLEKAKPGAGQRLELWDTHTEGFGYRASKPGKGSFFVMYRLDGVQRRPTLGRYPLMSLADARDKARRALQAVKENRDPVAEEAARLRDEGERRVHTLSKAVADFFNLYTRHRPATRAEVKRLFEKELLPALGARPVSNITRRDIAKVVNAVADRGAGTTANRLLAYLGGFFSWLVERGELDASPVVNLKKPKEERSRDRVLTDDELRAVWLAAGDMSYPFGSLVQILILTAQRRDEVAGMRLPDLNLDAGVWTLSREQTKSDRRHEVPLSDMARDIIKHAPKHKGDLVFPAASSRSAAASTEAAKHISGWSYFKRTLDEKMLILSPAVPAVPFTLHDIRRTVASGMARLGIAPHVVEKLLNHSTGSIRGVAAVYNRHSYAPEMRHAVDVWAQYVDGLVNPKGEGRVVELRPMAEVA